MSAPPERPRDDIGGLNALPRETLGYAADSDIALTAALAMIEAAAPSDEIEGALAVQMACTHTAAMAALARLGGGHGSERRVAALGSAAARLLRVTRDRLDELVPVEPAAMVDRQVIEWDKDDIDVLKFMKADCLALGMLSCMKRGFDLLAKHKGINLDLATITAEDPRTYAMIRKADTLGVFQIESRAQQVPSPHGQGDSVKS